METEIIKQNKVFLKELKEKLGIAGKIRHIQISPTYNKEGFLDDDKTSITFKEVNNWFFYFFNDENKAQKPQILKIPWPDKHGWFE